MAVCIGGKDQDSQRLLGQQRGQMVVICKTQDPFHELSYMKACIKDLEASLIADRKEISTRTGHFSFDKIQADCASCYTRDQD